MNTSSQAGLASFAALAVARPIIMPLVAVSVLAADAVTSVPLTVELAA